MTFLYNIVSFSQVTVDGRIMPHAVPGIKNQFITADSHNDDITCCRVEQFVLDHYKQNGYTDGTFVIFVLPNNKEGNALFNDTGARCSSVVRAFAHGAMGRRIDPSCGEPIELFLVPASAPQLVVCVILSVGWCI